MEIKNLIYSLIVVIASDCIEVDANININLDQKLAALKKILDYVIQRPEQMNEDAAFGITLSQAYLDSALLHANAQSLDPKEKETLIYLSKLGDETRKLLLTKIHPNSLDMIEISNKLNEPKRWMRDIKWKPGYENGVGSRPIPNPRLTMKDVADSIYFGHPNEPESDYCLTNLVKTCLHPPSCLNYLLVPDNATGYPLTHKLLILQVTRMLDCPSTITPLMPELITKFCSRILQNLVDIEAKGFPIAGPDLTSEQMVLCGMEGYLDFLSQHYERLILSWQHPSGCYAGSQISQNHETRTRRTSSITDFGCTNHATGLASAALALLIRKEIENATPRSGITFYKF